MRDWSINYMLHVLEAKNWSANRLAKEADVASSTINRPLREKDWKFKLSRTTINKIQRASGIDPSPFVPVEMREEGSIFSLPRPKSNADRALERLDEAAPAETAKHQDIRFAIADGYVQISAIVDRNGIDKLREKLDQIASLLED